MKELYKNILQISSRKHWNSSEENGEFTKINLSSLYTCWSTCLVILKFDFVLH